MRIGSVTSARRRTGVALYLDHLHGVVGRSLERVTTPAIAPLLVHDIDRAALAGPGRLWVVGPLVSR